MKKVFLPLAVAGALLLFVVGVLAFQVKPECYFDETVPVPDWWVEECWNWCVVTPEITGTLIPTLEIPTITGTLEVPEIPQIPGDWYRAPDWNGEYDTWWTCGLPNNFRLQPGGISSIVVFYFEEGQDYFAPLSGYWDKPKPSDFAWGHIDKKRSVTQDNVGGWSEVDTPVMFQDWGDPVMGWHEMQFPSDALNNPEANLCFRIAMSGGGGGGGTPTPTPTITPTPTPTTTNPLRQYEHSISYLTSHPEYYIFHSDSQPFVDYGSYLTATTPLSASSYGHNVIENGLNETWKIWSCRQASGQSGLRCPDEPLSGTLVIDVALDNFGGRWSSAAFQVQYMNDVYNNGTIIYEAHSNYAPFSEHITLPLLGSPAGVRLGMSCAKAGNSTGYGEYDISFAYYPSGIPMPTPTPTPSPTPTPIITPTITPTPTPTATMPISCALPWTVTTPITTPWDNIIIEDGDCKTIIPGQDVLGFFTIPGFEICIEYVGLPNMHDFIPWLPIHLSLWALIAIIPATALLAWIFKQWGG